MAQPYIDTITDTQPDRNRLVHAPVEVDVNGTVATPESLLMALDLTSIVRMDYRAEVAGSISSSAYAFRARSPRYSLGRHTRGKGSSPHDDGRGDNPGDVTLKS